MVAIPSTISWCGRLSTTAKCVSQASTAKARYPTSRPPRKPPIEIPLLRTVHLRPADRAPEPAHNRPSRRRRWRDPTKAFRQNHAIDPFTPTDALHWSLFHWGPAGKPRCEPPRPAIAVTDERKWHAAWPSLCRSADAACHRLNPATAAATCSCPGAGSVAGLDAAEGRTLPCPDAYSSCACPRQDARLRVGHETWPSQDEESG